MTSTTSKVTRVTEDRYAVLYSKPRQVAVTIMRLSDSDVLEFREAGRRAKFKISIEAAFRYAVQLSALKIGKRIKELRSAGMSKTNARKKAEREYLT